MSYMPSAYSGSPSGLPRYCKTYERYYDRVDSWLSSAHSNLVSDLSSSTKMATIRADREMHLVEFLEAAFYFRCISMDKEDVQRQMSAFRSAQGVSLEAGLWGRGHQRLGKMPGASPS